MKTKLKNSATKKQILRTETYLKNQLTEFIRSKGLTNEYLEFRYQYADKYLKEFSKTTIYPKYLESLAKIGNYDEIERIHKIIGD